jgi:hypothetical protein
MRGINGSGGKRRKDGEGDGGRWRGEECVGMYY